MEELNNDNVQGQDNSTPETDNTEKTTYTREEVDALLQKETDRRVTSALAKQQKKNELQLREAQKLAQMNEQQKYEYELSLREQAIAEKERQLTLAENTNTAQKILGDKGLDLDLVEFVVADDAEEMNRRINKLARIINANIKSGVEKRLGGRTPAAGSANPATLTKEQFKNLSLLEKQRLYDTDRELYKQLIS